MHNHRVKRLTQHIRQLSTAAAVVSGSLAALPATAETTASADHAGWQQITQAAKGQTVYWNAWGGAENINDYVQWVAREVKAQYQVELRHVKIADISETVGRILAEKSAGKSSNGSVDLMWINGENFKSMRDNQLLYGPITDKLPNFQWVDTEGKPTTVVDFTVPTDGMESPWGMARLVFAHDSETLPVPPRSAQALLEYAQANPGRVSYARPPSFIGTTFLKQALLELADDPERLLSPVGNDFAQVSAPLWQYLDKLTPSLWRKGRSYPSDDSQMLQLLDDGELDVAMTYDVGRTSVEISRGNLAESVRTYVFEQGTLGNTHFVAVPFNANSPEGAMVVANFLLSPEAQARKQDSRYWGEPTVLNVSVLPDEAQQLFKQAQSGPATLSDSELGNALLEPHPSWVAALEAEWAKRYLK